MAADELREEIKASREELLYGGNSEFTLNETEAAALSELIKQVPDSDPLIPLIDDFSVRPEGSLYFPIRRLSGVIIYGQVEAALDDAPLGVRARRFAEDIDRWKNLHLPNELIGIYNAIVDEAIATGVENPFLVEGMRASEGPRGYSKLPAVYAQAALEASAEVLSPPEPDEEPEEDEEPEDEHAEAVADGEPSELDDVGGIAASAVRPRGEVPGAATDLIDRCGARSRARRVWHVAKTGIGVTCTGASRSPAGGCSCSPRSSRLPPCFCARPARSSRRRRSRRTAALPPVRPWAPRGGLPRGPAPGSSGRCCRPRRHAGSRTPTCRRRRRAPS